MKCNKCGTPIIPGENACRICGNTNFSERVKEPEVIDFPDLDLEDKKEEKVNELPDLMDIIDIDEPKETKVNTKEEAISFDENEQQMPELILDEVVDFDMPEVNVEPAYEEPVQPLLELVEEPKKEIAVQEIVEVKEEKPAKKEKVKKVELDEPKSNKKKVLDKVNEKEEKVKKEPKEPKMKPKKNSSKTGKVLLAIILLCSIGLNIFLFINDGNNTGSGEAPKNEGSYSKVSYNEHKITIPSTWITENKNNSLLIYDDKQNWSASLKLINDSSYEALTTNKEKLVETLGSLKYQFTSNYSKSVNEKEFYLFKGKYYEDYSVFVIVTELDENTLVAVDLKFKGEVDDILLNNILTSMTSVKENNTQELFKDNFEFVDIAEQIKSVSKEIETMNE